MTTRSMRRRLARRPDHPLRGRKVRDVSRRSGAVQVKVSITDSVSLVSQSFLIMPGGEATALLTGYIEGPDQMPRVISVPIRIWAHLS